MNKRFEKHKHPGGGGESREKTRIRLHSEKKESGSSTDFFSFFPPPSPAMLACKKTRDEVGSPRKQKKREFEWKRMGVCLFASRCICHLHHPKALIDVHPVRAKHTNARSLIPQVKASRVVSCKTYSCMHVVCCIKCTRYIERVRSFTLHNPKSHNTRIHSTRCIDSNCHVATSEESGDTCHFSLFHSLPILNSTQVSSNPIRAISTRSASACNSNSLPHQVTPLPYQTHRTHAGNGRLIE
jgi:hypothetical protein